MQRGKTKRPTFNEHLQRARAVTERTRERIGARQAIQEVAVADHPLAWWRERWDDHHRQLFIETHIKVRDPRNPQRLVPMRFNRMQRHLYARRSGRDVCLKMRRGGMTTFWLAQFFADCVVMSGQNFRIVPHNPKAEKKFFADLKVMYRELPENVRPAHKYFSLELIEFFDLVKGTLDSRITTQSVQPGHEEVGRGEQFTHLLFTEKPFMRGDVRAAIVALEEACTYGKIADESTPNGIEPFHEGYQKGKRGEGGFRSHFYQWYWKDDLRTPGAKFELVSRGEEQAVCLVRPHETLDRDDAGAVERANLKPRERAIAILIFRFLRAQGETTGYGNDWKLDHDVAEYLAWRRTKIEAIGERRFLIEFPENDTECFAQTGRPVIGADYWKVTCAPREPEEGHSYLVSADCSLGLADGDPAAIQVIDLLTGRQCYEEEVWLSPDLLGVRVAEISDRYKGAFIVVERNGPGIATILKLIALGYETRLYKHLDAPLRRQVEDGSLSVYEAQIKAQYGFPTSAENKSLMGLRFEESVRCGYFGVSSEALVAQMQTTVWENDKQWGAMSGYHDDLFMAAAIGNFVMRYEADMLPAFVGVAPVFGRVG